MRETYQPPTTSPAGPPHDHTPGATDLTPAVDGNRHNATESDEPQRKLVPARDARTREAPTFRSRSLCTDRIRGIAWGCRLMSLMPIY